MESPGRRRPLLLLLAGCQWSLRTPLAAPHPGVPLLVLLLALLQVLALVLALRRRLHASSTALEWPGPQQQLRCQRAGCRALRRHRHWAAARRRH